MIWLGIVADLILLFLVFAIWFVIIKLLVVKGYKDYPPYMPTLGAAKKKEIELISDILKDSKHPLEIVDAGCGTASIITHLAKKFPQHQFVGIEWNKTLAFFARLRSHRQNNIKILCQDIFDYNFAQSNIVICFLLEPIMKKFEAKLLAERKKEMTIFSYIFKLPNIKAVEEITFAKRLTFLKLYIYKL